MSKARRKLENPLKSDFRIYSTDLFAPGGIYRVIVVGDSEKQKEKYKNMKDKQENRRKWKIQTLRGKRAPLRIFNLQPAAPLSL